MHLLPPAGALFDAAFDDEQPAKTAMDKTITSNPTFESFATITANWLNGKVIKKCIGFPHLKNDNKQGGSRGRTNVLNEVRGWPYASMDNGFRV